MDRVRMLMDVTMVRRGFLNSLRPRARSIVLIFVAGSLVVCGGDKPALGSTLTVATSRSAVTPRGHRERRRFRAGMVVIDRHGSRVGLITTIHQIRNGPVTISILVNGTRITVRKSKLRISRDGEEAVLLLTPSQIRTAAILNTF